MDVRECLLRVSGSLEPCDKSRCGWDDCDAILLGQQGSRSSQHDPGQGHRSEGFQLAQTVHLDGKSSEMQVDGLMHMINALFYPLRDSGHCLLCVS